MNSLLLRGLAVLSACIAISASAVSAATIFLDDMPATGSTLPEGSWDGINHGASTGDAAQRNGPTVSTDVNDPGTNSRRLFLGTPSLVGGQALLFTPSGAFDSAVTENQAIAAYVSDSWLFSYYTRNSDAPTVRLSLKVDSQWYVRNAASTVDTTYGTGGTDANNWTKFTVEDPFGTSGWEQIAFTETGFNATNGSGNLTRLTNGAAPSGNFTLPSTGNLNGLAVWGSSTSNFGLRLDLVTVTATAVPEPSTGLALLAGTGGFLLLRRRQH